MRHRHQLRAQAGDISKEDSGEGATEKLRQYDIYRQMLADHFDEPADQAVSKVELFEKAGQGASSSTSPARCGC